ncbi:MAG TPA: acetate kinase [candidate division Zixibacteria bacterium]|nr:acetate kinase [candidate division Zixibacteria bacterium]
MNILVVNCGSSSVKYQLIDMDREFVLAKGSVARIGMTGAVLTHKPHDRSEVKVTGEILDHIIAIQYVISILLSDNHGVIKDKSEIHAVGHRVVHGGEKFSESVLVDRDVLREIRHLIDLAPLHNPHNIRGINAAMKTLPDIPHVAVFDTAFHQNMPPKAFIYGIPYVMYKKYAIRRYGFHGPSHLFVTSRAAELSSGKLEDYKMISCHLGNGASVAAVDGGVSIDTSMGFTPLEGLIMGTRSGDMDPAVILHIMGREELTLHEANTLLNKHSGLSGVSGISSDMREIIESADEGNSNAKLAVDIYCYRLSKYIGGYSVAMGGLDQIIFTGGIGENSPQVREKTCESLRFLGVELDKDKNNLAIGLETEISTDNSRVKVMVIPTNEELVIARDTLSLIGRKSN